jgi:hypothetical protein
LTLIMDRVQTSAPGGTRTHGLQIRSQLLYPLSYGRIRYLLGVSKIKLQDHHDNNKLYCAMSSISQRLLTN